MSLFDSIRVKKPKRSSFNLSHDVKLSCNMGTLVPVLCEPVVPGDTFKLNTEALIRFAPLQAPVMHRVNVYFHAFFVPNRLIWDNWREFITGGEDGKSSPSYPRVQFNGVPNALLRNNLSPGSLSDFLGFPTVKPDLSKPDDQIIKSDFSVDALPFRAYHLIWNEYYRDQNLSDPVDIMKDVDGSISFASSNFNHDLFRLHNRCWRKDYFTGALPWPQRGEDVYLPLQGDAPIKNWNGSTTLPLVQQQIGGKFVQQQVYDVDSKQPVSGDLAGDQNGNLKSLGTTNKNAQIDVSRSHATDISNAYADLSQISSATINELRRAIRAQEFLEASARGGSRYIEQIFSIFGVKSSDARLQRPEFLGGGRQPVVISDVMQTSQTTESSAQGTPTGNAVSLGKTSSFKRYFEEHGYVMVIMSVLPVPAYQQGLPRKFTKFDRLDYYWPQFAHLGEQEIKNKEIYNDFTSAGSDYNDGTFGYVPRYAEYKYCPSTVHGDFRDTLNFWHMGRIFDSQPHLNQSFVTYNSSSSDRIFAVQDMSYDHLWVNIHHNFKAVRPMPKYGTPRL